MKETTGGNPLLQRDFLRSLLLGFTDGEQLERMPAFSFLYL